MIWDRIPVRLRLSVGHALWMGALFLGVGFGLYRLVEMNLFQSVDAALLTSAKAIRDARFIKGFSSPLLQSFLDEFLGEKFIRPYAQLVDLSGKVSAKTPNIRVSLPVTPKSVNRAELGLETFETFNRPSLAPMRQITLPVMKFGRFSGELIQVGAPLDATYHTLRGISLVLWIALPAGLVLSILFGYLLTARSLRPVKTLSRTAARLSVDDLSTRLRLPRAKDEIRTLTQTFNEMLDRLEDAFARQRRFSGDVSHELRTPISVLRGEAELALRKERTGEEYRKALRAIVVEATSMTKIVEDLLLLARAQSHAVAIKKEDLNTGKFLEGLAQSIRPIYAERKTQLEVVNMDAGNFFASPGYMEIALKNLLLNASRHTPVGTKVELRAEKMDHETVFTVKDSGEGIPEQALPYIFDPFYRADDSRCRDAGGTGIGLSLALALVELHGGTLMATSAPGQGATFRIRIPNDHVPIH